MEFNAVHSYVTNRIRILHQVAESLQSSQDKFGAFYASREIVLYVIFFFLQIKDRSREAKHQSCQHFNIFIFFNIYNNKHLLVYVSMFQ